MGGLSSLQALAWMLQLLAPWYTAEASVQVDDHKILRRAARCAAGLKDMMNRRLLGRVALVAGTVLALGLPMVSMAADETPDALIKRLSVDVLNTVRGDKAIQAGTSTR